MFVHPKCNMIYFMPPPSHMYGEYRSYRDGFEDGQMSITSSIHNEPDPTPSPRRLENRLSSLEREVTELWKKMDTITTPDQPAAARIDPDDEGQIRTIEQWIPVPPNGDRKGRAKRILTALAAHLNGPTDE